MNISIDGIHVSINEIHVSINEIHVQYQLMKSMYQLMKSMYQLMKSMYQLMKSMYQLMKSMYQFSCSIFPGFLKMKKTRQNVLVKMCAAAQKLSQRLPCRILCTTPLILAILCIDLEENFGMKS
jgi:hypothetical protein